MRKMLLSNIVLAVLLASIINSGHPYVLQARAQEGTSSSGITAEKTLVSIVPPEITVGTIGAPLPTPLATVNVTVANVTDMYAWQTKIYFDKSVISLESPPVVRPAPGIDMFRGFTSDQYWFLAFVGTDPGTSNRYLQVGGTLLADLQGVLPSVNGSGVVAQIKFRGVSAGSTYLNFSRPYGTDTYLWNTTSANSTTSLDNIPIPAILADGFVTVLDGYDSTPPTIGTPTRTPAGDVLPDQAAVITVDVRDSQTGVKNVTLSFTIDDGINWTDLLMAHNSSTDLYETTIPGQGPGVNLKYSISAYDNAGNFVKNDNAGSYFVYVVAPEFPSNVVLPLFIIITLIAVAVSRRTRKPGRLTRPLFLLLGR